MNEDSRIDKAVQELIQSLEEPKTAPLHDGALHEPAATFERKLTYRHFLKNKMLIATSIRHGLPWALFEEIQKRTPFSEEDWAGFLGVSTKSLQRYKASGKHIFKPIHSEKILELAEVTELGKEVFGDTRKFYRWLDTPVMALGSSRPSDLIHNSYGKELVMDVLHRIDHGIFA